MERGSCVNGKREQVKEKQNGLREWVQMTGRRKIEVEAYC